jgi:hypothetical protein
MRQPISCYPARLYDQDVVVRRFESPEYTPDYTWALPTSGRFSFTVDSTWTDDGERKRKGGSREQGN